jgi:hypothetical protein
MDDLLYLGVGIALFVAALFLVRERPETPAGGRP